MSEPAAGMSLPPSRSPDPAIHPWQAGLAAARANAVPGAVLSVFAVGLLVSYWYVPPVTAALNALADLKAELGWMFVVPSTAFFGGVLPWLVQRARPSVRRFTPWHHLGFLVVFWGIKGLEVDGMYRLQAMWFGQGSDVLTLTKKIIVDMGIYCPIWAVPTTVAAYAFKDAGYSLRGIGLGGRSLTRWKRWWMQSVLPVVISNWGVWVPAVMVIYCLPLALQLPVQNLVLCFWSLILAFQVRGVTENTQSPR
ncbi:Mpv17/PMP22 family protein [Algisphaera agarilytica]|uniref:Mpv17 / PMP22 family protein n=1 Tax=Algisphaera agarilytica TaxID=1385975 RepID=A0A7X0LL99_9BACT|nr:Mpv17/PMP22 family protein [Algisphaera agarilytica]MBB6430396.1 hypothetical protein [Algisphaera agarilytica]